MSNISVVVGAHVTRVTGQRSEWKIRTDPTKLLHKPNRKFEATVGDIERHLEKLECLERAIAARAFVNSFSTRLSCRDGSMVTMVGVR
jgi:hypothetical protein